MIRAALPTDSHMLRLSLGASPFTVGLVCALTLFAGATASVTTNRTAQEPDVPEAAEPMVEADAADDPYAQPIAFSHHRHVTEMGIACQMCHVYARRGPVAGIPSVQRCAQCHEHVLSDQPEVQKILEFWENEQPIPWVRVHDLPDHVRFSHKRHVLANVDCSECHGDVGQMEAAVQVESLSMGWCLNCHVERAASRDCLICHY